MLDLSWRGELLVGMTTCGFSRQSWLAGSWLPLVLCSCVGSGVAATVSSMDWPSSAEGGPRHTRSVSVLRAATTGGTSRDGSPRPERCLDRRQNVWSMQVRTDMLGAAAVAVMSGGRFGRSPLGWTLAALAGVGVPAHAWADADEDASDGGTGGAPPMLSGVVTWPQLLARFAHAAAIPSEDIVGLGGSTGFRHIFTQTCREPPTGKTWTDLLANVRDGKEVERVTKNPSVCAAEYAGLWQDAATGDVMWRNPFIDREILDTMIHNREYIRGISDVSGLPRSERFAEVMQAVAVAWTADMRRRPQSLKLFYHVVDAVCGGTAACQAEGVMQLQGALKLTRVELMTTFQLEIEDVEDGCLRRELARMLNLHASTITQWKASWREQVGPACSSVKTFDELCACKYDTVDTFSVTASGMEVGLTPRCRGAITLMTRVEMVDAADGCRLVSAGNMLLEVPHGGLSDSLAAAGACMRGTAWSVTESRAVNLGYDCGALVPVVHGRACVTSTGMADQSACLPTAIWREFFGARTPDYWAEGLGHVCMLLAAFVYEYILISSRGTFGQLCITAVVVGAMIAGGATILGNFEYEAWAFAAPAAIALGTLSFVGDTQSDTQKLVSQLGMLITFAAISAVYIIVASGWASQWTLVLPPVLLLLHVVTLHHVDWKKASSRNRIYALMVVYEIATLMQQLACGRLFDDLVHSEASIPALLYLPFIGDIAAFPRTSQTWILLKMWINSIGGYLLPMGVVAVLPFFILAMVFIGPWFVGSLVDPKYCAGRGMVRILCSPGLMARDVFRGMVAGKTVGSPTVPLIVWFWITMHVYGVIGAGMVLCLLGAVYGSEFAQVLEANIVTVDLCLEDELQEAWHAAVRNASPAIFRLREAAVKWRVAPERLFEAFRASVGLKYTGDGLESTCTATAAGPHSLLLIAHGLPEQMRTAVLAVQAGEWADVVPVEHEITGHDGETRTVQLVTAYRVSDVADPAVWVMTDHPHGIPACPMMFGATEALVRSGDEVPIIVHGFDPQSGKVQASIGMDASVRPQGTGFVLVSSGATAPGWSGAAILSNDSRKPTGARMRLLGLHGGRVGPHDDSKRLGSVITHDEGARLFADLRRFDPLRSRDYGGATRERAPAIGDRDRSWDGESHVGGDIVGGVGAGLAAMGTLMRTLLKKMDGKMEVDVRERNRRALAPIVEDDPNAEGPGSKGREAANGGPGGGTSETSTPALDTGADGSGGSAGATDGKL